MKIIIPVREHQDAEDMIVQSFHNTKTACVYNRSDNSYEWLEIKDVCEKEGNLIYALKQRGISTVISSHMPLMSLSFFVESGLKVYKASSIRVAENIRLFYSNKLDLFSVQSASANSICSGSCGSCNSSVCN